MNVLDMIRRRKEEFRRAQANKSEAHSRAMAAELKQIKEDRLRKEQEAKLINLKKSERARLDKANATIRSNKPVARLASNMAKFLNKQKEKNKGRDIFGGQSTGPFASSGKVKPSPFSFGGKGKSPFNK